MKGCYDELITKPLVLDLHMNKDVFTQHSEEHLLEVKLIPLGVVGSSKKITFKDMIALLDFRKTRHVIG